MVSVSTACGRRTRCRRTASRKRKVGAPVFIAVRCIAATKLDPKVSLSDCLVGSSSTRETASQAISNAQAVGKQQSQL
jgi:hypothetical protein